MHLLKSLGWAGLFVAAALAIFFLAGLLLGAWFHATVAIWMDYGNATILYWLIGTALFMALMVVLIW